MEDDSSSQERVETDRDGGENFSNNKGQQQKKKNKKIYLMHNIIK